MQLLGVRPTKPELRQRNGLRVPPDPEAVGILRKFPNDCSFGNNRLKYKSLPQNGQAFCFLYLLSMALIFFARRDFFRAAAFL